MPALTADPDRESVGLRRYGAVTDHYLASLVFVRDVPGKNSGGTSERSVGYGGPRATALFLGRLKHQPDGSWCRVRCEETCRTDQHRHVSPMSASVHAPGINGCIRDLGCFVSGQCIHFGTQGNRREPRIAAADTCNYGVPDAGILIGNCQPFEFRNDSLGSFGLLEG